ncbi:ketoacyl-ACP synthase III family protein [Gordonia sputi]
MTLAAGWHHGVRIASASTELPEHVELAVEALDDPSQAAGIRGVHVADANVIAPDLAVIAARQALDHAGVTATQVEVTLHSWTYSQGHDFWSPAHYIARELGISTGLITGVQQMCNGGAAALDIALAYLQSNSARYALLTTSDVFRGPLFDRWRSDSLIVYGDGGTAVVLGVDDEEQPDQLYIRSHVEVPMPFAEALHRDVERVGTAQATAVDVRQTKRAFMDRYDGDFRQDMSDATAEAVKQVIGTSASVDCDRITYTALPRLGLPITKNTYTPAVSWCATVEAELAVDTGHLGAGDLYANLARAHSNKLIGRGDFGLFISAGGGFTISATLVEAT